MFKNFQRFVFFTVLALAGLVNDKTSWAQSRSSDNILQGQYALQQKEYNTALKFFYRDTARASAGAAWFYIGQTYFTAKQYNDALDAYDNSLRHLKCDNQVITAIWEVFSAAMEAGQADVNLTIERFTQLRSKCPNSIEATFYLALAYKKGNFFDRARNALFEVLDKVEAEEKPAYSKSQFYSILSEACQMLGGGVGTPAGLDRAIQEIAPRSQNKRVPHGRLLAATNTMAVLYYERAKAFASEQEKYLKNDPRHETSGIQQRRCLARADSVYEIVIAIDRPNINHYLNAADVAEDLGLYEKAVRYYREGERLIQEKDSEAMMTIKFNLGKTLVKAKDYENALQNLDEAEKLNWQYNKSPQPAIYFWMGMAYFGRANSPRKLKNDEYQAEFYLRSCNNTISNLAPRDISENLADIYIQRGNFFEAAQALEAGIRTQEFYHLPVGDLQLRLGKVLLNQKDYPRAVVYFTDAMKEGADSLACLLNLGVAQRYLNQPQRSLASLELAQEIARSIHADSVLIEIKAMIGAVLVDYEPDRIKEAIDFLEGAVEEMPGVAQFKLDLVKAYNRAGDRYFTDAENLLLPIIKSPTQTRPNREQAWAWLGEIKFSRASSLIKAKEFAGANRLLDEALKAFEEAFKLSDANTKHMDDYAKAKRLQTQIMSDVNIEEERRQARNQAFAFMAGIASVIGTLVFAWFFFFTKKIEQLRVRTNTVAAKVYLLSEKLELPLKEVIKMKAQQALGEPWHEKLWNRLGDKDWKIIHDWQLARGLNKPEANILDHASFGHLRDLIAVHEPEWFEPIFQEQFENFKKLLAEIKSLRETNLPEAKADAKMKNRIERVKSDINFFLHELELFLRTQNFNHADLRQTQMT